MLKRNLIYILILVSTIPYNLFSNDTVEITSNFQIDISHKIKIYTGDELLEKDIDSIIRYKYLKSKFEDPNVLDKDFISNKDYFLFIEMDTVYKKNNNYFLSVDPSFTAIDLWFVGSDNVLKRHKSGTFTPVGEREFAPEVLKNLFHIDYSFDHPYLLLKGKSEIESISPNFRAELLEVDRYFGKLIERKVWNGFLYGFIALIALHGFILFYFLQVKSFFFYGLFTALAILTISYINKDLADFIMFKIPGTSPKYIYFSKIVVYGFAIAYLLFLRYATRKNITFQKWRMIFYWVILIACPVLVLDFILGYKNNFDPNITIILLNNYMFIVSIVTLVFAIQIFIKKQRRYFLFAIGIVFMAIGIFATGLSRLDSWIFSSFYYTAGVVLEVIFFSFGLGYNYYLLNKKSEIRDSTNISSLSLKLKEDEFLLKIYDFLNKNLNKPDLSVEYICESLSVSKAMLYRKLKEETDLTPIQMLNQLKMEKGMKKLNTTRLNVSEIAYELGFADPNYFTRRFTKYFGNPPSYYRNSK